MSLLANNEAIIKFGADYKSVTNAIRDINKQMRTLRSESRDLNNALKLKMDPEILLQSYKNAGTQVDLLRKKVEQLNKQKLSLTKSGADADSKQLRNVNLEIDATNAKIKNQSLITNALKRQYDELTNAEKQAEDTQRRSIEEQIAKDQQLTRELRNQATTAQQVSDSFARAFKNTGDLSQFKRSIEEQESSIRHLTELVQHLRESAKTIKLSNDAEALDANANAIRRVTAQIVEQRSKLAALKNAYIEANKPAQELGRFDRINEGLGKLGELQSSLRSLRGSITGVVPHFNLLKRSSDTANSGLDQLKATTVALGNMLSTAVVTGTSRAVDSLKGLVKSSVEAADGVSHFRSTMQLGGFNNQAITDAYNQSKKYADLTVYNTNEIVNTTAKLATAGIPEYEGVTEALGNLNAALGGTSESFSLASTQLVQIATRGKLTTEDFRTMTEDLGGGAKQLQDQLAKDGAYTGNFSDALSQGQISAQAFTKALQEVGMQDFAKNAAISATTYSASLGQLGATVQTFGQDVAQSLQGTAVGAINKLNNSVDTMLSKLRGPVINELTQVINILNKPINGGQSPTQSAVVGLGQVITGTLPLITMFTTLFAGIVVWLSRPINGGQSPIQIVMTMLQQVFTAVQPLFIAIGQAINQLVTVLITPIAGVSPLQQLITGLAQIIQAIIPFIPALTQAVVLLIVTMTSPLPNSNESPLQLIIQGVINQINTFGQLIPSAIGWFQSLLQKVSTPNATGVSPLESALNAIGQAINSIIGVIPLILESLGALAVSLFTPPTKNAQSPFVELMQALTNLIIALSPVIPTVVSGLAGIINVIASFVAKNPASVPIVAVLLMIVHVGSHVISAVIPILQLVAALSEMAGGLANVIPFIVSFTTTVGIIGAAIVVTIGIIVTWIYWFHRTRGAIEQLRLGFRQVFKGIRQIIGGFLGFVGAFANALSDLLHGHPIKAAIDLARGFSASFRQILTGAKNLLGGLGNIVGSFVKVGANIIKGIWRGIESSARWFKSKWNGLISWLPKFTRRSLEIHSPSRVMASIGQFIPMGLATGMDNAKSSIVNATNNMISGITSPFANNNPIDLLNKNMNGSVNDINKTLNQVNQNALTSNLSGLSTLVNPTVTALSKMADAFNGFTASMINASGRLANFNQSVNVAINGVGQQQSGGMNQAMVAQTVKEVLRQENLL